MMLIDLHIHTNNSDGDYSVEELKTYLDSLQMKYVAFTDHEYLTDSTGEEYDYSIINGIELYAEHLGKEFHILGYGIKNRAPLIEYLAMKNKLRKENYFKVLFDLSKRNVKIPSSYFKEKKKDINAILCYLVENKYASDKNEAYSNYLAEILSKYPLRINGKYSEVIDIIRMSSGISILAHPFRNITMKNLDQCLIDFQNCGLKGIECSPDTNLYFSDFEKMMLSRKLCITYGSDFHGSRKNQLLNELDGIEVNEKYLDPFMNMIFS